MSNKKNKIAPGSKKGIVKKEGQHQKMSPFSKNQERKWTIDHSKDAPSNLKSKQKKEEAKNANRSLKKGMRQQLKKDLQNKLNKFFD